MYVNRMLKTLREKRTDQEKQIVLTYIRNNTVQLQTSSNLEESAYSEICKCCIELYLHGSSELQTEAYVTLTAVISDFKDRDLNLFKWLFDTSGKKRLKILHLLDSLDENVFATLTLDPLICQFFNDCLADVDPIKMTWLAGNFCTDNLSKLTELEKEKLNTNDEIQEELVKYTLLLLLKIYKKATMESNHKVERFDTLLFSKVVPLAYMGHVRQRPKAIELLMQAVSTDIGIHMRNLFMDEWKRYRSALRNTYCKRMCLLVKAKHHDWTKLWCLSVDLVGSEIFKGSELMNDLLSVEEVAFKSNDINVKKFAFVLWQHLIDSLAEFPTEFLTPRFVKLLSLPLIPNNVKIESLILIKLEVYWHFINKLGENINRYHSPLFSNFLNCCFGPLGNTPFLSIKQSINPSVGKKTNATKMIAIEALSQIINITGEKIVAVDKKLLKERMKRPIDKNIFDEYYKMIIHSVGEAVVMISQLSDTEVSNKPALNRFLWNNLFGYMKKTDLSTKLATYSEVILLVTDLIGILEDQPSMSFFAIDFVLFELEEMRCTPLMTDLATNECLLNFVTKAIACSLDKPYTITKAYDLLDHLFTTALMESKYSPEDIIVYRSDALEIVRRFMDTLGSKNGEAALNIWYIVANFLASFASTQDINEGTAVEHDVSTVSMVVNFPFNVDLAKLSSEQLEKTVATWVSLYLHFVERADLIVTVKHNEILDVTVQYIQRCLDTNEYYLFPVYCLESLMNSINYQELCKHHEIPGILKLIKELLSLAWSQKHSNALEICMKTLSSFLLSVFGLNQNRAISYLKCVVQSVDLILKLELHNDKLEKEIVNTWETIVSIFRGLSKYLDHNILLAYKDVITLALRHPNEQIKKHAFSIIELQDKVEEKASLLLSELLKEAQKSSELTGKSDGKSDKKQIRMTGSFLNKRVSSPKPSVAKAKVKEKKFVAPPPPEPDSQDYVVIPSNVKFDVNRLTEHQKENLLKRRDDIPAMYNDLSQSSSQSQDTQKLQTWMERINENKAAPGGDQSPSKVVVNGEKSNVAENNNEPIDDHLIQDDEFTEFSVDTCIEDLADMENPTVVRTRVRRRRGRPRSTGGIKPGESSSQGVKRKADEEAEANSIMTRRRKTMSEFDGEFVEPKSSYTRNEMSRLQIDMNAWKNKDFINETGRLRSKDTATTANATSGKRSKRSPPQSSGKVDVQPGPRVVLENFESINFAESSRKKRKQYVPNSADEDMIEEVASSADEEFIGRRRKTRHSKPSIDETDEESEDNTRREANSSADEISDCIESSQEPKGSNVLDKKFSRRFTSRLITDAEFNFNKVSDEEKLESPKKDSSKPAVSILEPAKAILAFVAEMEKNEQKLTAAREAQKTGRNTPTTSLFESKQAPPAGGEATATEGKVSQVVNPRFFLRSASPLTTTMASPKSKRTSKITTQFTPQGGRTAHMLGLVTRQAMKEKELQSPKVDKDNDATTVTRKDKTSVIGKEPEKYSSPSSSSGRKDKIFSMMSHDSKLKNFLSKFKNDGDGASPSKDKALENLLLNRVDSMDHGSGGERSPLRDAQLPLFEWRKENPASTNASPSNSILKTSRTSTAMESESSDSIGSRRKRVSFADPPVSRAVGFEVVAPADPPFKINKLSNTKNFFERKDSRLVYRQARLKKMQATQQDEEDEEMDIEDVPEIGDEASKTNVPIAPAESPSYIIEDVSQSQNNDAKLSGEKVLPEPLNDNVGLDGDQFEPLDEPVDEAGASNGITVESTQLDMFSGANVQLNKDVLDKTPPKSLDSTSSPVDKLCEPATNEGKADTLEDTIDTRNMSSLTSLNPDDVFCAKLLRTSTHASSSLGDTLPVSDSLMDIQDTQSITPQTAELAQPELLDATQPIWPSLKNNKESVTLIVKHLTNPNWIDNLTKYLKVQSIKTIGDIARMSEREVNRIPIKGSNKAEFLRNVLQRYENSMLSASPNSSQDVTSPSKLLAGFSTPLKPNDSKSMSIGNVNDSINSESSDLLDTNKSNDDNISTPVTSHSELAAELPKSPTKTTSENKSADLFEFRPTNTSNGSLNTTATVSEVSSGSSDNEDSPTTSRKQKKTNKKKVASSKSVGVQMETIDLLDELDAVKTLESGAKRCGANAVFDQYLKQRPNLDGVEVEKEVMKLLGLADNSGCNEMKLRHVCRACGVNKVLLKIPEIFSGDKQFFSKVLNAYHKKFCIKEFLGLMDKDELRDGLCDKCTSEQFAEMLSNSLEKDEEQGRVTQITEMNNLDRLLKRMPRDTVISHTVANEEVIPSSVVLNFALANNNPEKIAAAVKSQPSTWLSEFMAKLLDNELPKEVLHNLLQTIFESKTSANLKTLKYALECITRKMGEIEESSNNSQL